MAMSTPSDGSKLSQDFPTDVIALSIDAWFMCAPLGGRAPAPLCRDARLLWVCNSRLDLNLLLPIPHLFVLMDFLVS